MNIDKRRVKITVRMTALQRADIKSAARKLRTTVNDYALRSMLARSGDDATNEQIKAMLEAQSAKFAVDFLEIGNRMDEQNERLRESMQNGFMSLVEALRKR